MKIQLWSVGKANEPYVKDGVADFTNRISKYFTVSWQIIPPPKNAGLLPQTDLKKKEATTILQMLKPDDFLVALDERGKELHRKSSPVFYSSGLTPAPAILFS